MSSIDIQCALAHVQAAIAGCNETLGFGALELGTDEHSPDARDMAGAYLSVSCGVQALYVGVVGKSAALGALVAIMLGLEQGDEPPDSADLADAVGEYVNVFAGDLKTRLVATQSDVQLGLPLYVHGRVDFPPQFQRTCRTMQMGDIDLVLVLVVGDSGSLHRHIAVPTLNGAAA